ncbi:MAG: ABC transporter permease [Planctomycetaceae bacterium]|nr:MAG: ABC transporter permease [Planctomycetaceae bacterium]
MTISRLIIREILHRKLNFALGLLSVAVAVGCLAGSLTLVRLHDARTQSILVQKRIETQEEMRVLEDDVRRAMQKLGFNIVILPKDQNLSDWYADDYGDKYMPEKYLSRLQESGIVTIEHLVPRLRQKVKWPETKWAVILVGTSDKKAVNPVLYSHELSLEAVPREKIVLGYEVQQGLGLNVGDRIRFMGNEFVVHRCNGELGTEDDMTVWINLQEAQELLNKKGFINEILAFECRSAWADLPKVRAEITRILPGTQVIEKASNVLAKVHAYTKVEDEGKAAIEREREHMAQLRVTRTRFVRILVSLVMVICLVWIALLAVGNVRGRRTEIGILRTLGFRSRQILYIFLSRAIVIGLFGGILGFLAGSFLGSNWSEPVGKSRYEWMLNFDLLGLVVCVAMVIAVAASWIPAMLAARQDPAVALRQE